MQPSLEIVRYQERHGYITFQLALRGELAVDFTVDKPSFCEMSEIEKVQFLERSAQSMIDIFGDARDGRILSDGEVQARSRA